MPRAFVDAWQEQNDALVSFPDASQAQISQLDAVLAQMEGAMLFMMARYNAHEQNHPFDRARPANLVPPKFVDPARQTY